MNPPNHQPPEGDKKVLPSDVRVSPGECAVSSREVKSLLYFPTVCGAPEIETGITFDPSFTFLTRFQKVKFPFPPV